MQAPLHFTPLMRLVVEVGDIVSLGATPSGERRVVSITGGSFDAEDAWRGQVLPGGADWQLLRADGVLEVDARYVLEDEGGARVQVVSQGPRHGPPEVIAALARGETGRSLALLLPHCDALRDRGAGVGATEPGRCRWHRRARGEPGATERVRAGLMAVDLGFTWRLRKNGDVEVPHRGRPASTLRGNDAADFLAEANGSALIDLQPPMARLTGN
jgi:hypothetical protein